jgi:hypothetical protein
MCAHFKLSHFWGSLHRFDPYLALLYEFYGVDLVQEKYPLISWPVSLTKRPAAHEIVSVSHHPDSNLLVVGMNSCIYESEQHHYGFVGERQLRHIRELVASVRPTPGLSVLQLYTISASISGVLDGPAGRRYLD